jgi:uncharacterized metal-binding protein YceD (DUF177 family)
MPGLVDASVHSAFSRPLKVEEVPPEGMVVTISATEAELRAIAAQDGLEGLAKLEGALHIEPWHKGGLAVTGEMRARVTQICVVTLEAFDSEIVEPIDVKFAAAAAPDLPPTVAGRLKRAPRSRSAPRLEEPLPGTAALETDDPPDPIIAGRIDLGALVTEFLALSLDPYPRKPGVEFEDAPTAPDDRLEESPFAKLAALKDKQAGS